MESTKCPKCNGVIKIEKDNFGRYLVAHTIPYCNSFINMTGNEFLTLIPENQKCHN